MTGDLRKIGVALATAGILGAWSFAATRASSDDIEQLKNEIEEVENEAKERHSRLEAKVEQINRTIQREAVEAASFRAQVRSALEIRDGN